jgi:hypothetical protein
VIAGTEGGMAGPRERRSPALAMLFGALAQDGRHSVLDLGPACGAHLRVLSPFASQVRFADLLRRASKGPEWAEVLRNVAPNPTRPYDVVLAWDILDRLDAEGRAALVAHLAAITAPRARLYVVVAGEGASDVVLHRFEILDRERVAEWPEQRAARSGQPLLPAPLERALLPFEIAGAYMLRHGAREYVAMKRSGKSE